MPPALCLSSKRLPPPPNRATVLRPPAGSRCGASAARPAAPIRRRPRAAPTGEIADPRALIDERHTRASSKAIEAFRNKELDALRRPRRDGRGRGPRAPSRCRKGPAWIAPIRGALVFVSLNTSRARAHAPGAGRPRPARPARAGAAPRARAVRRKSSRTARFCLRDDLLVLRFGAPLASLTPPVLRDLLREIGHLAARCGELLRGDVRRQPRDRRGRARGAGFEVLGRARKLRLGSGMMRSIPPPAPRPRRRAASSRRSPKTVPVRGARAQEAERASQNGPPPLPPGFTPGRRKPPPSRPTQSMSAAAPPSPGASQPLADRDCPSPCSSSPRAASARARAPSPCPAILAPMFAASPTARPPTAQEHPAAARAALGLHRVGSRRTRPVSMPEIDIEAPSRRPEQLAIGRRIPSDAARARRPPLQPAPSGEDAGLARPRGAPRRR